jgi:ribosomal protein S18 acetylase RimI-like enzyme
MIATTHSVMDHPIHSVRRIRADEGKELRTLRLRALACSPMAFAASLADEERLPAARWDEWARLGAESSVAATFVAVQTDSYVGLVTVLRNETAPAGARLASLWVAPEARGQGLVVALAKPALQWARDQGIKDIGLWVNAGNEAARKLYERLGFRDNGEPKAHPHRSTEGFGMLLRLDASEG